MTISCRLGDVDAHGGTLRARAASSETEHQALARGRKLQTAASKMAGTGSTVGSSLR